MWCRRCDAECDVADRGEIPRVEQAVKSLEVDPGSDEAVYVRSTCVRQHLLYSSLDWYASIHTGKCVHNRHFCAQCVPGS